MDMAAFWCKDELVGKQGIILTDLERRLRTHDSHLPE